VQESYAQLRKFNCWNISIVQQYARFKQSRIRSAVFGNSREFFISATNFPTATPLATAAGAAGGVLMSEGLHYAARKQSDKAYAAGYDKGKSDAVKQQYWLYVSMQRQRNQVGSVRLYPVQLPEQRIDGVTFQPSTKYLRIEE